MRELENLCWRLAALAPGDTISVADLDAALRARRQRAGRDRTTGKPALAAWARERLAAGRAATCMRGRARRLDRVLLDAALAHTQGHRGEAAARLGLGRNTVTRKLGRATRRKRPPG